jgi:hypothetical protein
MVFFYAYHDQRTTQLKFVFLSDKSDVNLLFLKSLYISTEK